MAASVVTLSEKAVARLLFLKAQKPEKETFFLRVSVSGGGCSGFQYALTLETEIQEDDQIFEKEGTGVIVDKTSLEFLKGSEIDYKEDLMGASFYVKNPNADISCGCGSSFSLK